jgi:cation transport regulator ChaB
MPYNKQSELPDPVKKLPAHAQDIYMAAFNSAFDQYKGDEAKSHANAWAAVKTKYKQDADGNWKAKESKVKESEMSAEDTRRLLQGALEQQFPVSQLQPVKGGAWVRDVYESDLVYEQDGQTYKISYSINDGKVTFGEPVKVVATTTYNPIESLRRKYAEVIQEAGRRGKVNDPKVQRVVAEGDKAGLEELSSVLVWLKEQAVVKTEDGVEFPASAYAYCPDKDKPSEWKLRLLEDPTKKVTRAQLGRAAAALSPGGFRGQKVDIPSEDLPAVKRKIRTAYRSLDVPDEEIPKWVKESEARTLITEFIPLTEASVTAKGRGQVRIIKPGFNESKSRYYPRELLARDYKVFEGNKMYADHPTESEERDRPERSIRDWVATLENVRVREPDGALVGDYSVVEPWMEAKLARLRDAGQLDKIGVSINAVGSASRQKIDGVETNFIERLVVSRSVDFVTEPGAGGRVEIFEATDPTLDVDLVGVVRLKERRPDIVKAIEDSVRNEFIKEVQHKMENEEKVKELEGKNTTLTQENEDLKGKIAEADKAKVKAEAQAKIKEAVGKAELPDAARTRLLKVFENAVTDEGIAEAIKAEGDYIAILAEAGKVKGMGPTGPDADPEKSRKELVESFKRTGMSDKEAEIAARGK